MPRKISTLLNVSSEDLSNKGVFDGFIDIDSRLHVDPSLLVISRIPEFLNSQKSFEKYFNDVMKLVTHSKTRRDRFWNEAWKRLKFKEIGNTALGYSDSGTGGNAIGPKLAEKILETVSLLSDAGVNDPAVFELVGLIEKGIGADRISDMTIVILIDNFCLYTQRIAKELKATTKKFVIFKKTYELPFDSENEKFIILVPKKLLNNLPIAVDWDDIDRVCKYNEELREKINDLIGLSWKKAARLPKAQLKKLFLEYPEVLKDLIRQYKEKPRQAYDFEKDPMGEIIWAELSERASSEYPMDLSQHSPITADNILKVIRLICNQFGSLIENNGWFDYLYNDKGKLKPERAPQLLFFGIAEVYCIANNLDLSRETNAGVGSLDFKVSHGHNAKVNVEIKYSTNPNIVSGFEKQLPTYNRAEKTDTSIYLIIKTKENMNKIKEVKQLAEKQKAEGKRVPEIIIVDGMKQVSASKRK
tara:strand:- start:4452 stop:5870 length:1419 start_codon:yes stop_codon:yes gene_type:complete